MKCSNCGMDNIVNDAVHCPNCGASLITPGNWNGQQSAPQQQYQQQPPQGPQPQYQQPPQQYYPPQPPKPQRVPTVKNIGLTEILFLFSGLFLIIVGFDNLYYLKYSGYGAQVFTLGILALLFGLFILAIVVMPYLTKGLDGVMSILMLILSLVFVIYGIVLVFSTYSKSSGFLGSGGPELIAAGLAGLTASGLKMGVLK